MKLMAWLFRLRRWYFLSLALLGISMAVLQKAPSPQEQAALDEASRLCADETNATLGPMDTQAKLARFFRMQSDCMTKRSVQLMEARAR